MQLKMALQKLSLENNLVQRILTAVVMIAVILGVLVCFESGYVFAVLLGLFGGAGVWELWRLVSNNTAQVHPNKRQLYLMLAVYSWVFAGLWLALQSNSFMLKDLAHGFVFSIGLVHIGLTLLALKNKPNLQHPYTGIYGAVLLACCMIAMLKLAYADSRTLTLFFSACIMVWATDIGGYFFGKAFGKKFFKQGLAPQISPNKSWEGAIGGVFLAIMVSVLFQFFAIPHWINAASNANHSTHLDYSKIVQLLAVALITLLFAAYSITGDLMESMLKRQAGAKDSSQLLPGHGGILDRIDALIPVMPLCMAFTWYFPTLPGVGWWL